MTLEREKKHIFYFFGGIEMNNTQTSIGSLQANLNQLVEKSDQFTEFIPELYSLSQQLDELIVEYYRSCQA